MKSTPAPSNFVAGQPTVHIPTSVFLSAHKTEPGLFTIGAHLQVGSTVGRQFNTPYMRWPEVEIALREWQADREEFLIKWFDWNPATVAREIANKGLPKSNPYSGLSLSDLGL